MNLIKRHTLRCVCRCSCRRGGDKKGALDRASITLMLDILNAERALYFPPGTKCLDWYALHGAHPCQLLLIPASYHCQLLLIRIIRISYYWLPARHAAAPSGLLGWLIVMVAR